jgi:hypothetical protein
MSLSAVVALKLLLAPFFSFVFYFLSSSQMKIYRKWGGIGRVVCKKQNVNPTDTREREEKKMQITKKFSFRFALQKHFLSFNQV